MCGIVLAVGLHFCITFDEGKHVILQDSSICGTAVSYSGQAEDEVRKNFTWILDLEKEEGKWDIKVHVSRLEFKVQLASHNTCKAEYENKVNKFLTYTE